MKISPDYQDIIEELTKIFFLVCYEVIINFYVFFTLSFGQIKKRCLSDINNVFRIAFIKNS